jgi:hypothetical protein
MKENCVGRYDIYYSQLMTNPLNVYNRGRQMFGGDNRNFIAPTSLGHAAYLDEFQQLQSTAAAAAAASANQLRLFTTPCNTQFLEWVFLLNSSSSY